MKFGWLAVGLCLVIMSGCDKKDERYGFEDQRNPFFAKAQQAAQVHDCVTAAKSYEEALQANPLVAQAHYELGVIYAECLGDQISAIYHFQKYLALRPAGENRDAVQSRLDSAKILFAATLPNTPIQNASEFTKLQTDKELLSKQNEQNVAHIAALEAKLRMAEEKLAAVPPSAPPVPVTPPTAPVPTAAVPPGKTPPAAPPRPATTPPAAVEPARPTTYTIQAGDNPWRIAQKFYPKDINGGIEKLKQANPETMSDVRKLKPGVVINLP
jgi:tetratricopeptide (TPR) repeat protein